MTTDQIVEERLIPPRTEEAGPEVAAVLSKAAALEEQARALIRKRPVVAVLAAVGAGFLVARLVSRASR